MTAANKDIEDLIARFRSKIAKTMEQTLTEWATDKLPGVGHHIGFTVTMLGMVPVIVAEAKNPVVAGLVREINAGFQSILEA